MAMSVGEGSHEMSLVQANAGCSKEEVKTEEILQEAQGAVTQEDSEAASGSSPPPHRPLTRSQTGTVAKRRKRDDSEDCASLKKRTPAPRKKQKSSSGSQSSSVAPEEPPTLTPPVTRETSLASSGSGEAVPALEFYDASPTSEERAECRLPRSRASLPTPIPNLTKKSRGRRVPTQPTVSSDTDSKDQRLYVCTVVGCGKCFHRGEHLKRHIRSIHTHEKPFKCSFPLCQKFFNRHDNLLQHLKVHRDVVPKDDVPTTGRGSRSASAAPEAPPSPPRHYLRERSYSPVDEPPSPGPPANPIPRAIYNAFTMSAYHNPYPTPIPYGMSDTASLITNMAVSSLRTELPHSPSADARRGGPLY